jgi:hypothetical protein
MNLQGTAGALSFTVQVKRADTGQVDEFQLIGQITHEQAEQIGLDIQDAHHGSDPHDSRAQRGD